MKAHRTDGVSLSFGIIFLLVALWWAISRVITIHLPAVGWLVAGALIMFGVIGLLGAIRSGRAPAPQPAAEPVSVAATTTTDPEIPGDLPPEMHASIVRELLDDPADRFRKEHPDVPAEQPRVDLPPSEPRPRTDLPPGEPPLRTDLPPSEPQLRTDLPPGEPRLRTDLPPGEPQRRND